MKTQRPKISVISGIFNCADTLDEAAASVLAQTLTDWEWILCDDGSTDDTYRAALQLQSRYPDKIVLLKNDRNRGLNYTLNRCLKQARGTYIARMDGDDRCHPRRFETEAAVLDAQDDVDIVSTDMTFFDETGTWGRISHPDRPEARDFLRGSPFCHAPCMVRKAAYDRVEGYSDEKRLQRVEDYHLWVKMYAAGSRGVNIHEPLYEMRDDRKAFARRKFRYRINEAYVRMLAVRMLGLPAYGYLSVLRPLIVGLLPEAVYGFLHKRRLKAGE